MKGKIKKLIISPLIFITFFGFIINVFHKEKPKEEQDSDAKEQPHTVDNRYSDPLQGKNFSEKSITASASAVNIFDDSINEEL